MEGIGEHNNGTENCASEDPNAPESLLPGPSGPAALGTALPGPDDPPTASSLAPQPLIPSAEYSPSFNAAVVGGNVEVPYTNSASDSGVPPTQKQPVSSSEGLFRDNSEPKRPNELQDSALDKATSDKSTFSENDIKKEPEKDRDDLTDSSNILVTSEQHEHKEEQSVENHEKLPLTCDASVPNDDDNNLEVNESIMGPSFFDVRTACIVSTSGAAKSASVETYKFDTRDGLWGIFQDIATFTMISELHFYNSWGWVSGFGIRFWSAPSPPIRGFANDAGPQVFQLGAGRCCLDRFW
jgi:hypothetical protein